MGKILEFPKLKLFIGAILKNPNNEELISILEKEFGKIDYISEALPFNYTDYYEAEMGKNLNKIFYSFEKLLDPNQDDLSQIKIISNNIEEQFLENEKRIINLDPGFISLNNLMLLTTKNFGHRIPLKNGIYIETTLIWQKKNYQDLFWTYPDFRSPEYKNIFKKIRTIYGEQALVGLRRQETGDWSQEKKTG